MAVNQLIAQGLRPIGADAPQIANMLAQRKQQEQQNALAQSELGIRQQNANLIANQQQAALAQREAEATKEQYGYAARVGYALSQAKTPEEFAMLADRVAADPQYQSIPGVFTREQMTPENVRATLPQVFAKAQMEMPQAPVQMETQNLPGGGILQRNPLTGELKQVVAPDRSDPRPPVDMYSPVDLDGGGIGSFDRRTGRVTDTGAKGKPKGAEDPMKLRKEFESQQSVKDFRTALPLLVSARKAPDNGFGDLQLIYTAGKVLDPGSVVREGELALTVAAGSPLQRVLGSTRFTAEKGGRLTPETRKQLLGMLNERVLAYRQAYDQDRDRFGQYASGSGMSADKVVGPHPANAYGKAATAAPASTPKRIKFEDM